MILSWDKPKKLLPTEVHNKKYQSDTFVPGTYVPNMSKEDMYRWKAKSIGGNDPRVEIRKTVHGEDPQLSARYAKEGHPWVGTLHAQLLVIVRKDSVIMSTNGKLVFDYQTWNELQDAVKEARSFLGDEN